MTTPQPPILTTTDITVLVDTHMRAFTVLYKAEKASKAAAKARVHAELAQVNVFGGERSHEDYVPDPNPAKQ